MRQTKARVSDTTLPFISIIIVVYNGKTKLETTILSVLDQVYQNVELIIIDGGSQDGTQMIIEKYGKHISYWVSEPDNGVYDAMNKGVKAATGNWLFFLGAGDVMKNILAEIVPKFKHYNTIYYGDVYKLDDRSIYDGNFSYYKLAVKNICHQAIFYPQRVFYKYEYDLKYRIQADHVLNIISFGDKEFKFEYLPVIITEYEGAGLSAVTIDEAFFNDKLQIIKDNFPLVVYWYAFLRNKIAKHLKLGHYRTAGDQVQ